MKQKLIIVSFLAIALAGAFSLKSNAQTRFERALNTSALPIKSEEVKPGLLADETEITYTKTGAKIVCSNDQVHFKLYQKWQHCFVRYSWLWKKDRKGPYKQYTITISKKDAELIKVWAKDNL